jgi:predicted phosphodiesterase
MAMTAPLRLAVLTDLHVGGRFGQGFQNPFLAEDARLTAGAAAARVREVEPDLVLVSGDLTHNASHAELAEVRGYLDGIGAPYIVCRGNHDCETPEARDRFDAAFTGATRAWQPRLLELPRAADVAVLVVEASWNSDEGLDSERPPLAVPEADLQRALIEIEQLQPAVLLVLCHYPLVSQAGYARSHGGPYAGHVEDGAKLVAALEQRSGAVLCFVGHNHYHHVIAGAGWLQCATGAIVEYPSEWRLVTIETSGGAVTVETRPGGTDAVAAAPPPYAPWVAGRPQDRDFSWRRS